jgi:putative SOS response-associated peptidase YedK
MNTRSAIGGRERCDGRFHLGENTTILLAMCSRFSSTLSAEFMGRLFNTEGDPPYLVPSWNLAPSQNAMVVRRHPETGIRRLDTLRWGLVPHFTKDWKATTRPINARAETVATSFLFRGAFAARRCIVPADLFYEWQKIGTAKQPYAIARADEVPLAIGGIWEGWRSADGEVLRTFAIITTPANREMRELHDRMPVVLEEPDWRLWLGEEAGDASGLLRPAPDGTLRAWPVSPRVSNPRNNDASLIEPMRAAAEGGGESPA